jgi:hypothetical protein
MHPTTFNHNHKADTHMSLMLRLRVQLRTTILENLRHVRPVSGEGSVAPSLPAAAAAHMAKQQQVRGDEQQLPQANRNLSVPVV